jgi:hypothetical protein
MSFLNFLKGTNKNHKSVRVKTSMGDKFINVNLDQTHESLDILSLKVFQKDLYRLFDSDYSIIVGRVNGNGGVGIPNCRISVFIPFDEEEITEPTKIDDIKKLHIASVYTYESVYDRDLDGNVYNLLPKYGKNRNFNGFPDNDYAIGATPKTPVGTFPEKEEILANDSLAYVYDKYYKYTTTTNESGDYILVVPSNRTFMVNMSCDITDIGRFSTTPPLLKTQGYADSFFKNENTQINDELPLEALPNVEIQNIPITTKPLWSQDSENTNVGINRLDFFLNKKVQPYTTVIGNYFTPNTSTWWGDRINFRALIGLRSLCVGFGDCKEASNNNYIEIWLGIRIRFRINIIINWRIFNGLTIFGGYYLYLPLLPDVNIGKIRIPPIDIYIPIFNNRCITLLNIATNVKNSDGSDFQQDCATNCNIQPADNFDINDCSKFCFGFKVKYIIPFFNFVFFRNRYCTLRGGKTKLDPWDLRFVLADACTRSTALQKLGGEITEGLFLDNHEGGEVDIKVFSIKNTINDFECNRINNLSPSDSADLIGYDEVTNIQVLESNVYAKYINDGNFIVFLPTNRKKVITNEEGDLIEIPFDSEKGVFTEFRGYFYLTHLGQVDNPPTQHRTAKIRLKIPQFFDYRHNNLLWVFKHYVFQYGEVYSVAQFNEVRYASFDQNQEGGDDDMLQPFKTKGWDEQTNIFFTGVLNDVDNNIYYQPNNNPDIDYTTFYNHITYLGQDGKIEGIDNSGEPPAVPPQPPQPPTTDLSTYHAQFRKNGSYSFTDTNVQNPQAVLYFIISSSAYLNLDFIIDFIRVQIYNLDTNFPNQEGNYKIKITRNDNNVNITKFTNTDGSEWLPITLTPYDLTSFQTQDSNGFTIDSNNLINPIIIGLNPLPNTPYLSLNDSNTTYSSNNGYIPCTLYIRKEYPNLNSPDAIKQIPIGIKVVQTL